MSYDTVRVLAGRGPPTHGERKAATRVQFGGRAGGSCSKHDHRDASKRNREPPSLSLQLRTMDVNSAEMAMTAATLLRCPLTGDSLALVDEDTLSTAASEICRQSAAASRRLGGYRSIRSVSSDQSPEFVTRYATVFLVLLSDFAILDGSRPQGPCGATSLASTRNVMNFYDQIGWQRTAGGQFLMRKSMKTYKMVTVGTAATAAYA